MRSTVADALQQLNGSDGVLFTRLMEHRSMSVEIYRPIEIDMQTRICRMSSM